MSVFNKINKIKNFNVARNLINKEFPIKLGYGAFGSVYLNKNKKNKYYALKKNDISLNRKYIAIAKKEIEILSKFNYNRIPKLYHSNIKINKNNTFDYEIYMEFFNGYDLYDCLNKKNIDIDLLKTFKYIKDISETLNYIHSFDYLYCDLKLENIIITEDGAKLVDFGQVRKKNIKNNIPFGTLTYTPIECIYSQNNFKEKSDYWCLGIIMVLLIYNIHPFISNDNLQNNVYLRINNSREILHQIFKNEKPVNNIDDYLLINIQELILNLINPNINERYGYIDLKNSLIWNYIFNKSYDEIL